MQKISYAHHRFPLPVIQHAIWLYFKFPLSYRDVEDLLAERGIDVSYETVRRWVLKFGAIYAGKLRHSGRDLRTSGIWMKYLSQLMASVLIYDAPLIMKAKCWKFWCNRAETSVLLSS